MGTTSFGMLAMYALGSFFALQPSSATAETLARSARFLRRTYIAPIPGTDQLAVWSRPAPRNDSAQLGATGLGLVTLIAARQAGDQSVPLSDLKALGRFLLALQRPDGSFAHRYLRSTGELTNWESLYYPGEAALGLIRLYEVDGASEWLETAVKALSFLAKSRAASSSVPADHWALISTAEMLPLGAQAGVVLPRTLLVQHAQQIVTELLRKQNTDAGRLELLGSFDSLGRTVPAATSLEGLLAADTFSTLKRCHKDADARNHHLGHQLSPSR